MENQTYSNVTLLPRSICLNYESWGRALTAIAGSMIIFGNLLVALVIFKYPARNFRPLNWFIVQLAIADFSVGVIVLWIGTFSALFLDAVSLMSSIMSYGVLASATSTSTLGVMFIALDRYFYILKHTSYRSIMTRRKVAIAIAVACVVPLIVFIVGPAIGWNCIESCDCSVYNRDPSMRYCFGEYCSQMMTPFRSETVLIGGISLALLLVISIFIYLQIFCKIRFQATARMRRRRVSETRVLKTMLLVLSGFLLTTGPLATCCIISFFYNHRELHFVMRTLVVLSTINSILNPLFYFWRLPEMNKKLRTMVRDCTGICCPHFPWHQREQPARKEKPYRSRTSEQPDSTIQQTKPL
ncbi:unnamed protein product [Clavelina lepadiformis]